MLCYVHFYTFIGDGVFNVCSAVTCIGKLHFDKDNVVLIEIIKENDDSVTMHLMYFSINVIMFLLFSIEILFICLLEKYV